MIQNVKKNECAVLKDKNGHPVPLTGLDIKGCIGDVFSRVTITQTYENMEEKNIEAIYSFPLPYDGVLLDFTVTLDGKVRHGTVMKKSKAREVYEDAVEQGNSAAMLEKIGDGLYSMSVGNLLAGQKVEISFTYTQFNIWNGKLLRFFLPSVVAPKYGDPSKAGIDDFQAPVTSSDAQNAMKCTITVSGNLGKCKIECPTHKINRTESDDGVHLSVDTFADRDFILEIRTDSAPVPYAVAGRDGSGYVSAVAMTPDFGDDVAGVPRDLDIIIDCSGSMNGQSMEQARAALSQILTRLAEKDSFNIIRFGSTVVPLFDRHVQCSEESLAQAMALLEIMKADLGGTELEDALTRAYRTHSGECPHDILLITDGQVYENAGFYDKAVKSGCRIFTVGVGNAVSEGLLRKLSQITGGMSEFVTPNENMAEKIVRHFQRMSLPVMNSEIIWPEKPDWIWPEKNLHLFHGDTALFFAGFSRKPAGSVELRTGASEQNFSWKTDIPETADETEISDLARMAVRRRISGRTDDDASELAVKYSLVTSLTNYILVEENADSENLSLPEMRVVPQMPPAGFMGAAACCMAMPPAFCSGAMNSMASAAGFVGMGMMGMGMAKNAAPMKSRMSEEPADQASKSGLRVYFDGLVEKLKELETADVKQLFAQKTVDALDKLGLPKIASDRLRLIVSAGVSERVLFIVFLNRLLQENQTVFAGTAAAEFITRGFGRLSASDQTLPAEQQVQFDELFSRG